MELPGFIGPSYLPFSSSIALERLINLYVEQESQGSKNRAVFIGTPGLSLYDTIPDSPHRAAFQLDGRWWGIAGATFFEEFSPAAHTTYPLALANDGKLASICSNGLQGGHQLFIVSGGKGYIFDTNANTLTLITDGNFQPNAIMGTVFDDYFISLHAHGFQASTLNDGTTWPGLSVALRSEGQDSFIAVAQSQRGIWFLGTKTSEVWYDNAAAGFPFAPIPGVFIEEGIVSSYALSRSFDNSLLWLGQNEWGGRIARRANGYTPERISTHGTEAQWDKYATVSDAAAWTYREGGHEFWVLTFPTAGATWVYDAASSLWHERAYLNPVTGLNEAILGITHAYGFGSTHLVGDRKSGKLYKQALGLYTDNGDTIVSERWASYVGRENKRMYHKRLELELQSGVGLDGNPAAQGANPLAMLSWSDNNGNTWSTEYTTPIGRIGETVRAIWRRLGYSRWRVYRVKVSDPVRRVWINAYLDVIPGKS